MKKHDKERMAKSSSIFDFFGKTYDETYNLEKQEDEINWHRVEELRQKSDK